MFLCLCIHAQMLICDHICTPHTQVASAISGGKTSVTIGDGEAAVSRGRSHRSRHRSRHGIGSRDRGWLGGTAAVGRLQSHGAVTIRVKPPLLIMITVEIALDVFVVRLIQIFAINRIFQVSGTALFADANTQSGNTAQKHLGSI